MYSKTFSLILFTFFQRNTILRDIQNLCMWDKDKNISRTKSTSNLFYAHAETYFYSFYFTYNIECSCIEINYTHHFLLDIKSIFGVKVSTVSNSFSNI